MPNGEASKQFWCLVEMLLVSWASGVIFYPILKHQVKKITPAQIYRGTRELGCIGEIVRGRREMVFSVSIGIFHHRPNYVISGG